MRPSSNIGGAKMVEDLLRCVSLRSFRALFNRTQACGACGLGYLIAAASPTGSAISKVLPSGSAMTMSRRPQG